MPQRLSDLIKDGPSKSAPWVGNTAKIPGDIGALLRAAGFKVEKGITKARLLRKTGDLTLEELAALVKEREETANRVREATLRTVGL